MFGPGFDSVGSSDGMALKDLAYPAVEAGDSMLLIDKETAEYTELVFFTEEAAKEEIGEDAVAGWYDCNGDEPVYMGNHPVSRGCGFWLFAGSGDVDATAAGEVKFSFSRTLPGGVYSAFANPFPAKKALKDFDYPAVEAGDSMLLIDKETGAYTELVFFTAEAAKEEIEEEAVAGWYDCNGDEPVYMGAYEFGIGEGVWIFPGSGDVTISATL